MKRIIMILLLAFPILFLFACTSEEQTVTVALNNVVYKDFSHIEPPDGTQTLPELSLNIPYEDFSIAFSKLVESLKEDENFAISPLSLFLGLASIYEVGDETVKKELKDFINISDDMISETSNLLNYLKNSIPNFSVNNSIWIDKKMKEKQEGLNNLADKLLTEAYHTEFSDNNEKANLDIKNYIKEKTNNLIESDYEFSKETLFAMINTLYFKANWKEELETESLYFNGRKGKYKAEYLVGTSEEGKIGENEYSRFFYINIAGAKLTLFIPKGSYSLDDVMNVNNINEINNYKYVTREDDTNYFSSLIFPSFKIDNAISMTDYFKKNGLLSQTMKSFQSNICKQEVCLSEMQHDVTIKVDALGIEGAAITESDFWATGAKHDVYDQLVINESFGFILSFQNVIIFAGQVLDLEQ